MTTTHPSPADYLLATPPRGLSTGGRDSDDHGAHLLRLVLDLQLDALLLGLGAAAVQESRSHPAGTPAYSDTPQPPSGSAPPWPRWTVEDVDLARTLAAEAVTSGAALPATLGPEPAGHQERMVLDGLAARYESMYNLLSDLMARTDMVPSVISRGQLHALLAHCEKRLAELHTLAGNAAVAVAARHADRPYLPGELLG